MITPSTTTRQPASAFFYHAARMIAALVLLQTLYFKFSGSAESVYIFSKVGIEPWGRYAVGVAELVAGILLVIRPVAWVGAAMALGLMAGAIMMHLTMLGIEVQNDGGYLFGLACAVTLCSLYVLLQDREAATHRLLAAYDALKRRRQE